VTTAGYKYNKDWRLRNPHKRQSGKQRNYAQTQGAENTGAIWSDSEMEAILADDRPHDRVLAAKLGRSVQAIQVKRAKLNGGMA
jgi:hypothetical protein